MKLTRSVGYAVGVLLQVQGDGGDAPMTAARISRGCRFPPRYLYRVLRRLVGAGILRGVSGPRGGYTLARPAEAISLRDIVAAVDESADSGGLTPVRRAHQPAYDAVNRLCVECEDEFHRRAARLSLADMAWAGRKAEGRRKPTIAAHVKRRRRKVATSRRG